MSERPTPTQRAYTPAGLAAAGGTMLAWGIGIVLIKQTTAPFVVVSFYRLVFALPFLLAAWLLSSERSLPWRVAGFGGGLFAIHQVFHFGALRYSTAAVVTILFALQPILVGATGRRVTGERTTPLFYLWAGIAICGSATLVVASAGTPEATTLGTVLAVGNLFAFSAYYLATKRARERVGTASWLLVMTGTAAVPIGLLALATGGGFGAPAGDEWIVLLLLGLIPGSAGHMLITWAHPRIHAAASSAVILGVPVVASAGAAITVGETFGVWHVVGGLIALSGAAMAMRYLPPPERDEAADTYGEAVT